MQIIYTFLAGIMPSTTGIKLSPNSLGPWFSIIYNSIYPSSACDYSAQKKKKSSACDYFRPIHMGHYHLFGPKTKKQKKKSYQWALSEATITIKPAQ